MSKTENLLHVSKKQKDEICKEFDITLDDYKDLTKKLHEFIDKSEHLPKSYDSALIPGAVLNNKANLQASKQFIENLYRIRSIYGNILFNHCTPSSKMFKDSSESTINVCARNLTPENFRVQYFKFTDPKGQVEDPFAYLINLIMLNEIRAIWDFASSTVVICDMKDLTYKSMLKYSLQYVLVVKNILHMVHFRIHALHFVNGPNIMEKFIALVKSALPEKLKHRLHFHNDAKSLQKEIPNEYLLKDYGGNEKSYAELNENWINLMIEMEPFFENVLVAKSTQKYEIDVSMKQSLGLGMEGTFKKLQID